MQNPTDHWLWVLLEWLQPLWLLTGVTAPDLGQAALAGELLEYRDPVSSDTSKCGSSWHSWNGTLKKDVIYSGSWACSRTAACVAPCWFLLLGAWECVSSSWLVPVGLMAREPGQPTEGCPKLGCQTQWCICFRYQKLFLHARDRHVPAGCL